MVVSGGGTQLCQSLASGGTAASSLRGDSSPGVGLKFLGFERRPLTTQRWEMGTSPGEPGNGQRKSSLPPTLMELAVFSMEKINPNPPLLCPEQSVPLVSLQTAAPAEDDTVAGLGAGQRDSALVTVLQGWRGAPRVWALADGSGSALRVAVGVTAQR